MPSTRAATVRADDLPDIATVDELAAFIRCDPRRLRADIRAEQVPGAFRVGRSYRVLTSVYLDAVSRLGGGHAGE